MNFVIFIFLFTYILNKGSGGKGSSKAASGGRGSLRNKIGIRFTSSRKYGRSRIWFSNHYVNIHYTGHHNYYNEEDYTEEDYDDLNENIYLIYAINGTFLKNHITNSNYDINGHYITFTEDNVVSDFLENLTEFQNIFGNDTLIIMPSTYIFNNSVNNSLITLIDEPIYQKVMIDVINDVNFVPFYKLFPKCYTDMPLFLLSIFYIIIFGVYFIYLYYQNVDIRKIIKDSYSFIYILLAFLIIYYMIIAQKNFILRQSYRIYLNKHLYNFVFLQIWQILQIYFIVYEFYLINNEQTNPSLLQISFGLCGILFFLEYYVEDEVCHILIIIIFLKILYFIYALYLLNIIKKSNETSLYITEQEKQKILSIITKISIIIILIILSEFYVLINNGFIFYSILLNFYLILIGIYYLQDDKNNIYYNNDTNNLKTSILNKL